jgi:hypothetical protein
MLEMIDELKLDIKNRDLEYEQLKARIAFLQQDNVNLAK